MSLGTTTATARNRLSLLPALGLDTTRHASPQTVGVGVGVPHGLLYLSINVWTGPLPDRVSPTAHTSPVDLTTATSLNRLYVVPTLGLGTMLQLVPFQCIVSVW